MKICNVCNAEIHDDMQFCGKCGASLAEPKKTCPRCGNEVDDSLYFCDKCGTKLPAATEPAAAEPAAAPAPEPPAQLQPVPPPIAPVQTYPPQMPPPAPPITVETQVKREKRHVVFFLIFAVIAIGCAIAGAWLVSEDSTYYDSGRRIDENIIYGSIGLMAIGIVIGIILCFAGLIRKRKSIRKASVITIIIFCVIAVAGGIVGTFTITNSYYYHYSLSEWRMNWAQLQFGFIFMTGSAIITAITGAIANLTKKRE